MQHFGKGMGQEKKVLPNYTRHHPAIANQKLSLSSNIRVCARARVKTVLYLTLSVCVCVCVCVQARAPRETYILSCNYDPLTCGRKSEARNEGNTKPSKLPQVYNCPL